MEGWRLSPWGSAIGCRHHTCVTIGTRWFSQAGCRPHGRSSSGCTFGVLRLSCEAPTAPAARTRKPEKLWIRLPRHKWPKSWYRMEDPVVLLEGNLYGHLLAGLLWERQFEKILLKHSWEKIPNWKCLFAHCEEEYSSLRTRMTENWLERNKILVRCGNFSTKKSIWENQHLSLIRYTWAALEDNVK